MGLDLADVLQVPQPFEFEGKTYTVTARSFAQEALFATWVSRCSLRGIEQHKDDVDPQTYQTLLQGWRWDKTARVFDWGSPLVIQTACTAEGSKYLAFLSLREGYEKSSDKKGPPVSEALVERIFKDADAWNRLWDVMTELNNPNRKGPPSQAEATTPPAAP